MWRLLPSGTAFSVLRLTCLISGTYFASFRSFSATVCYALQVHPLALFQGASLVAAAGRGDSYAYITRMRMQLGVNTAEFDAE